MYGECKETARSVQEGRKESATKRQGGCKKPCCNDIAKRVQRNGKEGARRLRGGRKEAARRVSAGPALGRVSRPPPGVSLPSPGRAGGGAGGTWCPQLRSLARSLPGSPLGCRPARGEFPRCAARASAEEPGQRSRACSALPCTVYRRFPGEGTGGESPGGSPELRGCSRAVGPERGDRPPGEGLP